MDKYDLMDKQEAIDWLNTHDYQSLGYNLAIEIAIECIRECIKQEKSDAWEQIKTVMERSSND